MAYVLPQLDDEEQKQQQDAAAPKLGGTQSLGVGTGGALGQAPIQETPKSQNVTQRGTGFTNLQNWLDAGKGRDQNISSTGKTLLGGEKTAFNAAAKPLQDATYKAKTFDPATGNGAFDMYGRALKTGDTSELKGMLDNKYEGPRTIDYNPNARKGLWDVGSLTDAKTASNVLARPAMEAGRYGSGMQRLDQVLYGADAASRAAMDENTKGLEGFAGDVKKTTTDLGAKVEGFDKAAADANSANRDALNGVQDRMNRQLDQATEKAQQRDAQLQAAIAEGKSVDARGNVRTLAPDEMVGNITGGGATRENIATTDQRRGLDLLADVLGGSKLGQADAYQNVQAGAVKNPNYVPQEDAKKPVSEDYVKRDMGVLSGLQRMMDLSLPHFAENLAVVQKMFAGYSPEERDYIAQQYMASLTPEQKNNPNVSRVIEAVTGKKG